MLRVRYIYSACVVVESADLKVVSDPWFTDGAFDGSWFQYPKLKDPVAAIGKCDFIYISHIHPDHYDAVFLRQYLKQYPKARILIGDFKDNYLSKKMRKDGFQFEIINELCVGNTKMRIFRNDLPPDAIDSALVVKCGESNIVNMNDNFFFEPQLSAIRDYCGKQIDIALMGFTGAGHYPQTYYSEKNILEDKARLKKAEFFERYKRMRDFLGAKVNIPFAGQYVLGGKLTGLNEFRGVSDATEVLAFDTTAVVLADGGEASIDTSTLTPTAVRKQAYNAAELKAYLKSIQSAPMLYEAWFKDLPVEALPFERLLPVAYGNALKKSQCKDDYYFVINLSNGSHFTLNARMNSNQCTFNESYEKVEPRSEIQIDPRYLFGILTGVFHWNNAEVGSQYMTHRVPDKLNRDAQAFLNFLHV